MSSVPCSSSQRCDGRNVGTFLGTSARSQVQLGTAPVATASNFGVRGGPCKHVLRALLARGDEEVLGVLRGLVPYPS